MSSVTRIIIACLSAAAISVFVPPPVAAQRHNVPEGFVIEKVAGAPEVVFPMFACFDDRSRLFVAESSGEDLYAAMQKQTRRCRIRLLEDRGPDGRFRKSHVFADRLNFPMGLVWRDGKLYVADPPDLVTLEDTNGDGRADRRSVILSGFGHTDNGSLHGLIFGPDGLLYMTMGSPDGYKLKREDGASLEGQSGALIRCRPDGSEPEVVCRGFVNLVEVAFTARGEAIGTDNWFRDVNVLGRGLETGPSAVRTGPSAVGAGPSDGGLRDALVHLVDGGLYPYHPEAGTPQPVTGEPLPPIALFPAVALSGLTAYRGPTFPAEMRGQFFSAQHNARKVCRHVLVPAGSTFRSQDFDFVTSDDPDFHPSDVLEDADGSLLVIDTGSWYIHHCPTGQIRHVKATGGIYRVKWKQAPVVEDPWGVQIDWKQARAEQLVEWLGDRRPAVQDRARLTLVGHGKSAVPVLAAALSEKVALTVKQQAVWALAAILDDSALPPLRKSLGTNDPEIVIPSARALAARADSHATDELVRLLASDSPQVQLAAAEALARCGNANVLPMLWKALRGQPDRFLEHTIIHAIHRLADAAVLRTALEQPHPRVQKAALLLLDQPPRPRDALAPQAVITRLSASEAELRQAALWVVQRHPEWAEHAIGLIRRLLKKAILSTDEETCLRTLLLKFQDRPPLQDLIGESLAEKNETPVQRQLLVLDTMAQVNLPEVPAAWIAALARTIRSPNAAARGQAVRTAAVLQIPKLDGDLLALAGRKEESAELRLEALRAIILRRPALSDPLFDLLLGQLDEQISPLMRLTAAEVLGRSRLSDMQMTRLMKAARDDALVSPSVLLPALQRSVTRATAAALLDYLAESLRQGWRPPEADLNKILDTLPSSVRDGAGGQTPQRLRQLWRQSVEQQRARLAEFEPLLAGGSAERGRKLFSSRKVACATCHRIGNEGGQIAPDLTRIGAIRAGRDILESIVFPSSTIAQGYESYIVTTKDGRSVTGVITRRTADVLVMRDSSGAELRLHKAQVDAMNRSATSLMPEGLDKAMTRDELRDLLAFLQSLK
jgi:putative membrane-bound dehydrogenase-like protein